MWQDALLLKQTIVPNGNIIDYILLSPVVNDDAEYNIPNKTG
jgi:hypothetical protein